jgi:pilus assembly protein CpaB
MKRRLLIIVLALVFAAIGTGGVLAYAKGADARAITGMKAVSVLVAKKPIPAGTSAGAALNRGLLAAEKMPAASVPSDAVRSVVPALSHLVTSAAVQPGQLLLRAMLVKKAKAGPGAVTAPGAVTLPAGMIEVTINLCVPEAVAGGLQAGSQVAVFDTIVPGAGSAGAGCSGQHIEQPGTVKTRVVLPRVQVMSVGTPPASGQASSAAAASSAGQSTSAGSPTLVTLAVSQADAERLIQVSVTGLPYLALLSTASRTNADVGRLLASVPVPSPTPTPTPSPSPTPTPTKPSPAPAPTPAPTKPSPPPKPTPTKTNGFLKLTAALPGRSERT